MKSTKRRDKRMMKVFCNWIDKESPIFLEWLDYGFDDVAFLSGHAKRVGIRRKTAWESSRKFLKHRCPDVDERKLREWFEECYDFETTDPAWRQVYFNGKPKAQVKMQSISFSNPELMKCIKTESRRP